MLVACLAMLLHRQRDAAGFIAYHKDLVQYVPPLSNPQHLRRIFVEMDNLRPQGTGDTAGALHYLGDVLKPRGMVVLVSDLLHPIDEMIDHLKSLRARRHDVVVLQISDPAEQTFPFGNSATFVDAESGDEQYAVPDAVRGQYLASRQEHFDFIRRECLANEIDIAEFTTTEPLDRALHFFLNHRNHALIRSSLKSRRAAGGKR